MTKKTLTLFFCIAAILIALVLFRRGEFPKSRNEHTGDKREQRFNREPSKIIYSRHARCRMACRQIDETEVREILEKGVINDEKSDPASNPDPKYALEGVTHDGQEVRIIFAVAEKGMVVITVIDLQKEWSCNCN